MINRHPNSRHNMSLAHYEREFHPSLSLSNFLCLSYLWMSLKFNKYILALMLAPLLILDLGGHLTIHRCSTAWKILRESLVQEPALAEGSLASWLGCVLSWSKLYKLGFIKLHYYLPPGRHLSCSLSSSHNTISVKTILSWRVPLKEAKWIVQVLRFLEKLGR